MSQGFYKSVFTTGKQQLNIEDVVRDGPVLENVRNFLLRMQEEPYESKAEYDVVYEKACQEFQFFPETRLDTNLVYYRLLGDGKLPRSKRFEKFSVLSEPCRDVEEVETTMPDLPGLDTFVKQLAATPMKTQKDYMTAITNCRKTFKISPGKLYLQRTYWRLVKSKKIPRAMDFERFTLKKSIRSSSGVLVVTVLTSPYPDSGGKSGRFDCAYDCAFCPSEPGMPRSYISTEPAVRRAIQNHWDPCEQFIDRVSMLSECGHVVDKLEVLVLGGTWSSYPLDYRENFVRDLYYTANCRLYLPEGEREERSRLSLAEERLINETTACRIIGLTLETRPDCINKREIVHLRECGCTRVQLGIQHTDDEILAKIKRQCKAKHNQRGIRMLKEAGFKVDIHLMPDLPGSDPVKDYAMFHEVITGPDYQADQWKIYPCSVVRHSLIEKWYNDGSYKPYYMEQQGKLLVELIMRVKAEVPPWIRLNRVIRDIPEISILAGNDATNMRQLLEKNMQAKGMFCDCIRCREVRDTRDQDALQNAELVVREYDSSGGKEYFISFESPMALPKTVKQLEFEKRKLTRDKRGRKKNKRGAMQQENGSRRRGEGGQLGSEELYSDTSEHGNALVLVAILLTLMSFTQNITIGCATASTVLVLLLSYRFFQQRQAQQEQHTQQAAAAKLMRRKTIYAFLRLRINQDVTVNVFPELVGCSLIRELHVYGRLIAVADKEKYKDRPQHSGFGRRLIARAAEITRSHGLLKMSVISGDGVKEYYRKVGFNDEGHYLIRSLE